MKPIPQYQVANGMSIPICIGHYYLMTCLILSLFISSCAVKIPAEKSIKLVVQEANSNEFLENVEIKVISKSGQLLLGPLTTDRLGFQTFKLHKITNYKEVNFFNQSYQLIYSKRFANGVQRMDSIILSPYLPFYQLHLDSISSEKGKFKALPSNQLVADMHYHVSMRTHNLYGYLLYQDSVFIPDYDHLNWFKHFKKLKVLKPNGRWRKVPYFDKINFEKIHTSNLWQKREHKMKALLQQKWLQPKAGNIKLTEFTQATHPHIKEGNVYLAFNAFSPFEHGVSNYGSKRLANNLLVTGADLRWLRKIGKRDRITHWENFKNEYKNITSQNKEDNYFTWRFFDRGINLDDNYPTIINVVEGAHVLQHKYFPDSFTYNIANRSEEENHDQFNRLLGHKILKNESTLNLFKEAVLTLADTIGGNSELIIKSLIDEERTSIRPYREWRRLHPRLKNTINSFVDSIMMQELVENIHALKNLDGPPIVMMTVAHLTYNGMMGHAPNLDGGNFLTNLIAKKNYSIKVSDDPTYISQWSSIYLTVPGVNKFGKRVIERLLATDNGHRILIDLKHCDFSSREYYFEQVLKDKKYPKDSIPPICSHCAVTGLPSPYHSPLTNEYRLLQSPSTTTFYPFGINLYDSEIRQFFKNKGIIGLTLEQRVLGGYINKRQKRRFRINRKAELRSVDLLENRLTFYYQKRKLITKRWISYLFEKSTGDDLVHITRAVQYTRDSMGVEIKKNKKTRLKQYKDILRVTAEEYWSAEPFLQNIFHLIDHSGLENPEEAWDYLCIGSDLDGLIDPIDICSTAGEYKHFKRRLEQFIPIFLAFRQLEAVEKNHQNRGTEYYFDTISIKEALNKLFYTSLKEFTKNNFYKTP